MDRDVAGIREEIAGINQQLKQLVPQVQTIHDALEGDKGIIAWRKGVDIERGFVRVVVPIILGGVVTLFGNSCSLHPNVSPLVTSTPIAIYTLAPTDTPTPTAEPTPAPIPPATDTPTPEPTRLPTIDWSATPTQQTNTPSIVEVTPLGGDRRTTGTYTTVNNQRARKCPGIECDVSRTISAGQTLRFYDWLSYLPLEAWVCITTTCTEWMASTWEGKEMGVVTFDE